MEKPSEIEKAIEEFKKKKHGWFTSSMLFFFGIILPAAALIVELSTNICSETDVLDPLPTPLHVALVASVPLVNLLLWICAAKRRWLDRRFIQMLAGFAFGVSIVYAVEMLPLTALGLLGVCALFWYFGAGFIGLLPGAPLFASIAIFRLRARVREAAEEKGVKTAKGFAVGLVIACFAWLVVVGDAVVMGVGVRKAVSDDPVTAAEGVRLCRLSARKDILRKACTYHGDEPSFFKAFPMLSRILVGDKTGRAAYAQRDILYYRITGEEYSRSRGWGRYRDSFVSGEKVGNVVEGLSLSGSVYDTTVDDVAGIGYCEWTLTFANSLDWVDREARCRIALPHGAVVSRLTLWVNGEESEAAFGRRGQVRRAYESVVKRNLDPVLVNVSGPDEVQLQCFPVPRKGEMKVRLGVTVPLAAGLDGKLSRFAAPTIIDRNFTIPSTLLGLPETTPVFAKNPVAEKSFYFDETMPTNDAIVQTWVEEDAWIPRKAVVVVDTSAAMAAIGDRDIHAATEMAIPSEIAREYWLVDDLPPVKPVSKVFHLGFAGGRYNLRTLVNALDSIGSDDGPVALVWLHGPELVTDQGGDVLAQKLRKHPNVRFYDAQALAGRNPLKESLADLPNVITLNKQFVGNTGIVVACRDAFSEWKPHRVRRAVRERVPRDAVEGAAKASRHLGVLWAAEEAARIYRVGDPVSLEKAQEAALPWHVVTPVTGAVVLETKEQFKENGLEQVDVSSVPTTPEPSSVLCFVAALVAMLVMLFVFKRGKGATATA